MKKTKTKHNCIDKHFYLYYLQPIIRYIKTDIYVENLDNIQTINFIASYFLCIIKIIAFQLF